MQGHATTRRERQEILASRWFDLLVVGGGITGCGIARDAALRGLAVALVDKGDFASGTSSRSSRLVHGGVRYLETGQIHLVFEASAERRRLLRIAPHLVHPLPFTWPVYAGARIARWKLGAGLFAYDALAMFRNVARHERLSAREVLEREPMLRSGALRGGARYFDAATDDARLTLANAVGAADAGAIVLNHAAVTALRAGDGRIAGASVVDRLDGATFDIRAQIVVNATGPWSGDLRAFDESATADRAGAAVRGSKGAHISVPRERVGNRAALTLLVPADGRVFFVLPSGAQAIIGTTDTFTSSSPDAVRATRDDVRYLLDAANAYFPRASLGEQDVVSAWAGIRPLLPSAGETPGRVSREHAVAVSASGLVSITGGKLTTFRIMARDVMRVVLERLGLPAGREDPTRHHPLPGGDFADLAALEARAATAIADETLASRLVRTYGTRWSDAWDAVRAGDGRLPVDEGLPYTLGELRYAVRAELACTLGDLLIRRTHVAHQSRDHGVGAAERVAVAVAPLLGWDAAARRRAIRAFQLEIENEFAIDG